MEKQNYECKNCKQSEYLTGEIRTTGSGISRFLNLQNNKFVTVSCKNCGYTDLYKTDSGSKWGNVLDIFTN
jgi:predicted nucleic-acid-binding Zn-ribbon protein